MNQTQLWIENFEKVLKFLNEQQETAFVKLQKEAVISQLEDLRKELNTHE